MSKNDRDNSSETDIAGASFKPRAEQLHFDEGRLAICLRAVRFQADLQSWKSCRYYDVPSYGVGLQKVRDALCDLTYLIRPLYEEIPGTKLLVSDIEDLIDESFSALDQYDNSDETERGLRKIKDKCDCLISLIFEDFLHVRFSDLNSSWVSIVTSRPGEEQLKMRDELLLSEAVEKGIPLFNIP